MPQNLLYPSWCTIEYFSGITGTDSHFMTLPVLFHAPAATGTTVDFVLKDGTWREASLCVADLLALVSPFYTDEASFSNAEIWTMETPTSVPVLQYAFNPDIVGTAVGGANRIYSQLSVSFHTFMQGKYRLVLLEGEFLENVVIPPPYTGSTLISNLVVYMLGDTSFVTGRDNQHLYTSGKAITKTNDALRKKGIG